MLLNNIKATLSEWSAKETQYCYAGSKGKSQMFLFMEKKRL